MSDLPFTRLRPPRAPAELRGRVLEACAAVRAGGETDGLLDILWRSRRARWAWLLVVVALWIGNQAVLPSAPGNGRNEVGPVVISETPWIEADLPPWWHETALDTTWADLGPAYGRRELDLE